MVAIQGERAGDDEGFSGEGEFRGEVEIFQRRAAKVAEDRKAWADENLNERLSYYSLCYIFS
jgi:hypothetical protein